MDKKLLLSTPLKLSASDNPPPEDGLPQNLTGVLYSGGVLNRWGERYVIDLETVRIEAPLPLLFQHDHETTVGVVEKAKVGSEIIVEAKLFSDIDTVAADIARKSQAGLPYEMSAGVFEYNEEEAPAGKRVEVNGQTFQGPITVLRDALIREASIAVLGADQNTSAKIFSQSSQEPTMPEPNTPTVEDLQAQIQQLTQQLEQANARAAQAERNLRMNAVRELFEKTGMEFSEEAAKPYLDMPQETFEAVKAQMFSLSARQAKPQPPEHLFQAMTPPASQQPAAPAINTAEIYAKRNNGGNL